MESEKYVPPALRNRAANAEQEQHPQQQHQQQQQQHHSNQASPTYQRGAIDAYFSHSFHYSVRDNFFHNINITSSNNNNNNNDSRWFSETGPFLSIPITTPRPRPAARERERKRERERRQGTLNTTSDNPDTLAYITLYTNAHPFWHTKREILCKSHLDLLPTTPLPPPPSSSSSSSSPPSYPLFINQGLQSPYRQQPDPPAFAGYHRIRAVRYLEPHSRELAAYLELKFGTQQRTPEKWAGCFSRRWAVISVEMDGERVGWEGGRE
ncbi:hypothetical protein GX51_03305 [Blastomyces parvus]|uniref:Uncharacterized protein n=1 Tax=Blastomyces parvus TaxID=2060905 RepID=A0A2B7X7D7_9EURO|nr:hypothetical protein GX51_03305 [Blastomyces parvus]